MFLKPYCEWMKERKIKKLEALFEHETYKRITGTNNSYRQDSANTSSMTDKHSHVYAKLKGGGKELYSVNQDGSGHDGYSGTKIPQTHADFFRSISYKIREDNILENLSIDNLSPQEFMLIYLDEN